MQGNYSPSASRSDLLATLVMMVSGGGADCLVISQSGAGLDGSELTSLLSSTSWSFHNLSQYFMSK